MSLILWMSSRSDLPVRTNPQTGEAIRTTFTMAKLAHVFEYSVFALLLLRALTSNFGGLRLPLRTAAVATVIAAGLVGGMDELRQSMTPSREPRFADIALDMVSALAACLVAGGWQRYRRQQPGARARGAGGSHATAFRASSARDDGQPPTGGAR